MQIHGVTQSNNKQSFRAANVRLGNDADRVVLEKIFAESEYLCNVITVADPSVTLFFGEMIGSKGYCAELLKGKIPIFASSFDNLIDRNQLNAVGDLIAEGCEKALGFF